MKKLDSNNLCSLLAYAAETRPEAPFFYYNETTITYADALRSSRRLAGHLHRSGFNPGDMVLLCLGNIPEFIYAFFAIAQLGAVSVLVNPAARYYELEHIIRETRPRMAICDQGHTGFFNENEPLLDPAAYLFVNGDDADRNICAIIELNEPYAGQCEPQSLDPAAIIFTSGMDGYPLGAMIPHRAIMASADAAAELIVTPDDVFLTALPLFHSFSLTSSLFVPLSRQVPFHLIGRFSPKRINRLLTEGAVSVFCGVPLMFQYIAATLPAEARFPAIKALISGGDAIEPDLQTLYEQRFATPIRQGYGLTEASPIVTWNRYGRENRIGSIGQAMPYNEVRLFANNSYAEANTDGEIVVKGLNVIPGYFNNEAKTREYIVDGWLHTGDLGRRDDNGYFYITGRLKNMIIRGGLNVYPREVERIMKHHPSVADVRVTPIQRHRDNRGHEGIEAVVYPRAGQALDPDEMMKWCKAYLSSYKLPDEIRIA